VGKSGGLALLWNDSIAVEILNYSSSHINACVSFAGSDYKWKFIGFYRNPDRNSRHESWKLLSHLGSFLPDDWLCTGDFNEIVDSTEKAGGSLRSTRQMELFRHIILENQLSDLGFRGSIFTWSNKRDSGVLVKECLDRALATTGWCENFPDVEVNVLVARCSDHKPLWIRMLSNISVKRRVYSFKYEASWNEDKDCEPLIQSTWEGTVVADSSLRGIQQKLHECKVALLSWSSQKFGNVDRRVKSLTRRLESLQWVESARNQDCIKQVQREIEQLLEMEDIKWKQRAKRNWIIKGDRNTKFYHACANQRKRKTFISEIGLVRELKVNS
jgi:hypothetical protein